MKGLITALLLAGVVNVGCVHARHAAVVADAAFSTAIFALDDAEFQACQQHVLTQAQCDAANPAIKQALLDVKAVTLALQATPRNVALPKKLPDLLADLTTVQAILGPAANIPQAAPVLAKVRAALDVTLSIIRQFTAGGK